MADEPATPEGGTQDQNDQKPEPKGSGDRTFTQAELDRIVKDRLERQKGQFGDYDDLKKAKQRLDEIEQQNQSESEKLLARLEKAEKAAEAAAERERQAQQRINDTLIRAAVVSHAAQANVADPGDVYTLLGEQGRSKLAIDDHGQVSGVEDAVKGLLDQKPYLVAKQNGGGFDGGARGSADQGPHMNDLIRQSAGIGT